MAKVIVVNGVPRSGKDTFVEICRELLDEDVHKNFNFSTVDFVKEVATFCGWNGEKTPHNRKFLSDLKDLLTQWNDIPMKKLQALVRNSDNNRDNRNAINTYFGREPSEKDSIIFVMCREPQEIQRIKEQFDCITLLIRRESVENIEQSNHADAQVFDYNYDFMIYNNSDIIELTEQAKSFLTFLKLKMKGEK